MAKNSREVEILVLARLARAMDMTIAARHCVTESGLGERLEHHIIAAMSELDQAERLNSEVWTAE